MIKKTIWIALMAIFFVKAVALAQIGTVTARTLLVRSGPSKRYKVIAKMKGESSPLWNEFWGIG